MKRKFTKLMAAFTLLALLIPFTGWGQAPVNTVLWGETWTDGGNAQPSNYGFTGTTVYGNATLTYANSSTNTKLYNENSAGGTAPELLLSKNNQTWTISGIPTGSATGLTLTFKANYDRTVVSSTTSGVTIGTKTFSNKTVTYPITIASGVSTFTLVFTNTDSNNVRIDNIELVVTTAGSGGGQQLISTTTEITASQNFNNDIYVGTAAGTLTASVTYDNNGTTTNVPGATVTWASSDPTVATVDQTGAVTLVAVGTTNITATYAGDQTYATSSDTYQLTVIDNTPSSGTDVTFVAGTDTGTTSVTKDGITVSMSTMSRTDNYRCYANSDMTVTSVAGKTITKVVLTCVSGNGANLLSIPTGCPGSYSYSQNNIMGTWTGSTSTVTLHASSQVRMTQIVVTYETDNTPTISVSPSTLNTFSYLNTSTDPSAAQQVSVSGANLSGNITVSVGANSAFEMCTTENGTYSDSDITLQQSSGVVAATSIYVRMKANQTGNPTGTLTLSSTGATSVTIALNGSVVTPMTVAQAITAIDNASGNDIPNAYVTGIVSSIVTAYDSGFGNVTFDIVDAVGNQAFLRAYRCGGSDAANVAVGDVVVVSGTLYYYSSGSLYEFHQGCQIVSLTPHQAQQYTLEVTSVTNAGIEVFDATDPDDTNWTLLFEDVDDAQVYEGTPIALSVSADQGYAISELMVNNVNHVADINGGLYTFNMPSQNVTITVTAVPAYDITYSENGVETQVQVLSTTLTLPVGEDLDSEFAFAGWTTTPGNFVTPTAAGTTVNIQGGETFYAVYARIEGREAYFEKVTEDLQDWSGNYLIVAVGTYANEEEYSVAFDGSLVDAGLDASQNTIDVEIDENDRIEYDAEGTGISYFTIAPIVEGGATTGWSIQSASGYYIGRTANSNGMNKSDETVYSHTLSIDANENAVITSSASPALRYNKTSDQKRFRYYTNNGQQPIQLFKEVVVSQGTPVYYTRVFIWETAEDDITITGPSIVPSGSMLDMDGNTLTNANAANLIIEDGAQVIYDGAFAGTMLKDITAYPDINGNAGYYLIASPIEGLPTANGFNGFLTQDYDLYAYDATAEPNEWINYKQGAFTLIGYHGYLYASGQNTTLTFAGLLNDPDMNDYVGGAEIELAYGDANNPIKNLTLVGNSGTYETTFRMFDYNEFNQAIFNYLTLNEDGNGFITKDAANEPAVVAPMDAIFVQAPDEDYFLSNDDVYAGPETSASQGSNVNVKVSRVSGSLLDNAIMSFNGSMMRKIYLNDHSTRVYFPISNEDYAVVPAQLEGDQPVNFKANENGTYVLSVEVNNLEMNYLHLIDNMTGADVDLLATPSYTFEARTTDYASRFRLVFSAEENGASTGSATFAFFNGSEWVISNTGEATLQVVDVLGRVLSTETVNGNATINVNQPTGVYMLRLINGDNVRVQKVVVR